VVRDRFNEKFRFVFRGVVKSYAKLVKMLHKARAGFLKKQLGILWRRGPRASVSFGLPCFYRIGNPEDPRSYRLRCAASVLAPHRRCRHLPQCLRHSWVSDPVYLNPRLKHLYSIARAFTRHSFDVCCRCGLAGGSNADPYRGMVNDIRLEVEQQTARARETYYFSDVDDEGLSDISC